QLTSTASALPGIIAASTRSSVRSSTHSLRIFYPPFDNPENDNSQLCYTTEGCYSIIAHPFSGTIKQQGVVSYSVWLYNAIRHRGLGAGPQGCKPAAVNGMLRAFDPRRLCWVYRCARLLLFAQAPQGAKHSPARGCALCHTSRCTLRSGKPRKLPQR